MKKFGYSYLVFIILAVILNAAYDPTTGTGGGGDAYLNSNQTFTGLNTWTNTATFLTNVNIQPFVTGDLSGAPALLIGTNLFGSGAPYMAIGVPAAATGANQAFMQKMGNTRVLEWLHNGIISLIDGGVIGGGSAGSYIDSDEIQFIKNAGAVKVWNASTAANSSIITDGGSGAGSSNILRVSGIDVINVTSNNFAISTNVNLTMNGITTISSTRRVLAADGLVATPSLTFSLDPDVGFYRPAGNTLGAVVAGAEISRWGLGGLSSRGFGVAVSGISATTNSLLQVFSGTYSGTPATVTFGTVYAAAPTVTVTTTDSGGTAILNDTVFVTNITTTTCVIGYRNGAGASSAATLTFNGIALGRQ